MKFLDKENSPLGFGCWPIGGEMYAADGTTLGYSNSNDKESIKAIGAAIANGISIFDTAAAYGAGHSERLLGHALGNNPEACIVTKIGLGINETTRTITGEEIEPKSVLPAIDHCLKRLSRDVVDCVLLHPNTVAAEKIEPIFDEMEKACQLGKIRSFGWSTDFVENVQKTKKRDNFVAVEHAMHVLMDAPAMQAILKGENISALIRSPLAMGLLSGKYTTESVMHNSDIRSTKQDWTGYYIDGKPNPEYMALFDSVRELLQTDGRTTVQGALSWLWAKSPNNIPIPGARTVEQVEGLAKALEFGALPGSVMNEIDELVSGRFTSDGKSPR